MRENRTSGSVRGCRATGIPTAEAAVTDDRVTNSTERANFMMDKEVGNRDFPIWLVGDSNPVQWPFFLRTLLDPRHSTRHNIWTAILDVIQDSVFREGRSRVDTSSLFIRNAVDDPAKKPDQKSKDWEQVTENEIDSLRVLIQTHRPIMLLCFGAFAFEFTRWALDENDRRNYGYWGATGSAMSFAVA